MINDLELVEERTGRAEVWKYQDLHPSIRPSILPSFHSNDWKSLWLMK
jgi:hypothetical protein